MTQAISLAEAAKLNWAPAASFNKYGNQKTVYDGFEYDSRKEANFAAELDQCKHAKDEHQRVVSWERQVPFKMKIKKTLICTYYCDFVVKYADGRTEHIDVKGVRTDVYKLKKKLMKALHGIDIREV